VEVESGLARWKLGTLIALTYMYVIACMYTLILMLPTYTDRNQQAV